MVEVFSQNTDILLSQYNSNLEKGLTEKEVIKNRNQFGKNILPKKRVPIWNTYVKPALNPLIIILLICGIILGILGSTLSAYMIIAIISVNSVIAVVQQFRAQRTLDALKAISAFQSSVLRNGIVKKIPSSELVPGDIMFLSPGDHIGADGRILECSDFTVDESSLTGESRPVEKSSGPITLNSMEEEKLQDMHNMVFMNTFSSSGNAKILITAIGVSTQIGKIAADLETMEERDVPLQRKMTDLAKKLGLLVIITCGILFVVGIIADLIAGNAITSSFLINRVSWLVSLAVAAIPLNFPIIITIVLLTGLFKLAKEKAIVRNLSSVESLGRIAIICSDKTGTITENQMTVKNILYNGHIYEVSGNGYGFEGSLSLNGSEIDISNDFYLKLLVIDGLLNNNAHIEEQDVIFKKKQSFGKINKVIGLPTEGALIVLARKSGLNIDVIKKEYHFMKEISFSSSRKMMSKIFTTKINENESKSIVFSKGAAEILMDKCNNVIKDDNLVPLTEDLKASYGDEIDKFASSGFRVLAFSYKDIEITQDELKTTDNDIIESDQILLGFCALQDPPRKEVPAAIKECGNAGVKVLMITGDHPKTAISIAKEIGLDENLIPENYKYKNIESMSDDEITHSTIFPRATPQDKLKIIDAYQKKGYIVAMTGDGINDALALEKANAGIAMGLMGTDVAKSAADLVLTDDSFATISEAIFHGRGLFNNIRANVFFLMVANLMELTVLSCAFLFMGGSQIFNSLQLNLFYVTVHFFPPFGLMFNQYNRKELMNLPPKDPKESILSPRFIKALLSQVASIAIVILIVYGLAISGNNFFALNSTNLSTSDAYLINGTDYHLNQLSHSDLLHLKGTSIVLIILMLSECWVALSSRSEYNSIFKTKPNYILLFLVGFVIFCLYLMTHLSIAHTYLNTIPLTGTEWLFAILLSFVCLGVMELYKWSIRTSLRKKMKKSF